jgi:hypothetical protein
MSRSLYLNSTLVCDGLMSCPVARRVWLKGCASVWVSILVSLSGVAPSRAQVIQEPAGTIRGTAFDSTTMAPMVGATLTLIGLDGASVLSQVDADENGDFLFSQVAAGERRILLTHPRLADLRLTPLLQTIQVRPGKVSEVRVSTPSLRTLWPLFCPGDVEPVGPGILAGWAVDSVTGVAQPVIDVAAEWRDPDGRGRRVTGRTQSDGSFALCGIPLDYNVRIEARFVGQVVSEDTIRTSEYTIQSLDLSLPVGEPGTVRGVISDAESGSPIASTVVTLEGTEHRVVTGSGGDFVFSGLEQGEYILKMEHLAYGTQSESILVGSRTLLVDARLAPEAIELEGINVTVLQPELERRGFYQRRRRVAATNATVLTGDELMLRDSTNLPWALRNVWSTEMRFSGENGPTLQHRRRGYTCDMPIFLDGMLMLGFFNLGSLKPDQILGIEIYPPQIPPLLPFEYLSRHEYPGCGGILIWTK